MKRRMVENIASSTSFNQGSIESAYATLMNMPGENGVALADMNRFTTHMSYADVVSSSAASQVIKEKSYGPNGETELYA